MSPPPPYSENRKPLLDPRVPTTASSLKKTITKRDGRFASFIVNFILYKLEALIFETPRPLGWTFTVVSMLSMRLKVG